MTPATALKRVSDCHKLTADISRPARRRAVSRLRDRLGRGAARRRWLVLGIWVLAVLAIGFGGKALGGTAVDDFKIPGTETQRAMDLLKAKFPEQSGAS